MCDWQEHLRKKVPHTTEFRLINSKSSNPVWYRLSIHPEKNEAGKLTWYGQGIRIGQHQKIEECVARNEERMAILMDNLPGVVYQCEVEQDWPVIFVSKNIEQLTGFPASKFLDGTVSFNQFASDDSDQAVWDKINADLKAGKSFELIHPFIVDGKEVWVWEQGSPVYNPTTKNTIVEGLIINIDKQVRAQQKVREHASFIEHLTEQMPNMLYVLDVTNRKYTYANQKFEETIGWTLDEINSMENGSLDIIHPNDQQEALEKLQKLISSSDQESHHQLLRVKNKDGEYRWLESRTRILNRNEQGEVTSVLGITSDVTARQSLEFRIRESENELKALLNGTLHSFYLIDAEHRIIHFNAVAAREVKHALGIEIKKGDSFLDVVPDKLKPNYFKHSASALAGEVIDTTDTFRIGKVLGHFRITYYPISNKNNPVDKFVFSSVDLTEMFTTRKQLEDKENLLNAINKNIGEGLYRSKVNGEVIYVNQAFTKLFGYDDENELIGKISAADLYANPEDRKVLSAKIEKSTLYDNFECQFKRKDGSIFWGLISSSSSVDDNGDLVYDGAIRDITDFKKIQQELVEAKESAEEMNRMKSNFLANMSHEIRTPINGIIGLAQVMETETDPDSIGQYIPLLKQSGERLLNTITSILDLSRLEANKQEVELKSIDIDILLQESSKFYGILAAKRGIEFQMNLNATSAEVFADKTIFNQMITNLIGNAIKFTDKGKVEVSTELAEGGSFILVHVLDTGIGISPEFQQKLFEPFEQESKGYSRSYEGSGLGLSITKKYTELLGGSIGVKSKLGEGSIFTLKLPIYK